MTEDPHPGLSRADRQQAEPEQDTVLSEESRLHPREMRLRASRPQVTRLSQHVLIGGSAVAFGSVLIALSFALWPQHQVAQTEQVSTGANILPEGITRLPREYTANSEVPKLGPPLPGDLGKPMLNAGVIAPGMPAPTPEQQRFAQAQDNARTSKLFIHGTEPTRQVLPSASSGPAATNAPTSPGASDQDHKLAFLTANLDHQKENPERLQSPSNSDMVQAGAVIPAALITGLRSDLPGEITAQVTENVLDSITGSTLLIPQGSRLIGQYDAHIAFGQSRALLVWTRLILPNGKSINLERQPGTDAEGYAGLEDQVDGHWGSLFKAAVLSTVLSVGTEASNSSSSSENNLAQAVREGASQSSNQVGQQVVGRSLNVQPTITIRPGFPVRVLVTHDLILEPYRE